MEHDSTDRRNQLKENEQKIFLFSIFVLTLQTLECLYDSPTCTRISHYHFAMLLQEKNESQRRRRIEKLKNTRRDNNDGEKTRLTENRKLKDMQLNSSTSTFMENYLTKEKKMDIQLLLTVCR